MKKKGRASDSGGSNLVFGSITLVVGLAWLGRALFHIVWHRELSFGSDAIKGVLIIALGVLLFWARRKEQKSLR
jgi:hypothetical protein